MRGGCAPRPSSPVSSTWRHFISRLRADQAQEARMINRVMGRVPVVIAAAASLTAGFMMLSGPASAVVTVPRFDHVVIVVMENKNYGDIIGRPDEVPYLSRLAAAGAVFSNSYAITHPSQPNYLALFSGSTQGVTSDNCPQN